MIVLEKATNVNVIKKHSSFLFLYWLITGSLLILFRLLNNFVPSRISVMITFPLDQLLYLRSSINVTWTRETEP